MYVARRFVLVKCAQSVANFRNFAPALTVLKSNEFQSFLRTQSQLSEVPLHGLRENKINLQTSVPMQSKTDRILPKRLPKFDNFTDNI